MEEDAKIQEADSNSIFLNYYFNKHFFVSFCLLIFLIQKEDPITINLPDPGQDKAVDYSKIITDLKIINHSYLIKAVWVDQIDLLLCVVMPIVVPLQYSVFIINIFFCKRFRQPVFCLQSKTSCTRCN